MENMRYDVISIFPDIFEGFKQESILGKAKVKKLLEMNFHNLRDWGEGKHKTLDDIPFGGGPGMVLKVGPIFKAVETIKKKSKLKRRCVIHFSPRGKLFTTKDAKRYARYYDQLIFICGRYEGVDERVAQHIADETISIGDFILIGGEVAAMAVMEATSRFIPKVIGRRDSVQKNDHAQYTRPEDFKALNKKGLVPKVLVSGNHKAIAAWRKDHEKKS